MLDGVEASDKTMTRVEEEELDGMDGQRSGRTADVVSCEQRRKRKTKVWKMSQVNGQVRRWKLLICCILFAVESSSVSVRKCASPASSLAPR
jgi:hypothetical protein